MSNRGFFQKFTDLFLNAFRMCGCRVLTPSYILPFILFHTADHLCWLVSKKDPGWRWRIVHKKHIKKFFDPASGIYRIKDAVFSAASVENEKFFCLVFIDTFWVYVNFDDCYGEKEIDNLYCLSESTLDGPYGLQNETINVRVEEGDVVLDAGSWIGDFAAYASAKGATVYAFEPSDSVTQYLSQTAALNKNIHIVKQGLGNAKTVSAVEKKDGHSSSDHIVAVPEKSPGRELQLAEMTTIDAFVQENGLKRVDFIKADIEGYERYMLEGARETLKKFAPKLAICTYHLPDDPEVLAGLILRANPRYTIVQKKKKLYASVPAGVSADNTPE